MGLLWPKSTFPLRRTAQFFMPINVRKAQPIPANELKTAVENENKTMTELTTNIVLNTTTQPTTTTILNTTTEPATTTVLSASTKSKTAQPTTTTELKSTTKPKTTAELKTTSEFTVATDPTPRITNKMIHNAELVATAVYKIGLGSQSFNESITTQIARTLESEPTTEGKTTTGFQTTSSGLLDYHSSQALFW